MEQSDSRAALALVDAVTQRVSRLLKDPAWWPMVLAAVTAHMDGRGMGITALADTSGLPRSTAREAIFAMRAAGLLAFQPISRSGRRCQIVPSASLLDAVRRLGDETIRMVVGSVRDGAFDGLAAAAQGAGERYIAYPQPRATGFDRDTQIHLFAYADPVFDILRRNREEIELFAGCRLKVFTWTQDAYLTQLPGVLDAAMVPDIVAVPFPWLAEVEAGHGLLCLDGFVGASPVFAAADYYPQVWNAGQIQGRSFGIPVQPTVEFLWYRKDLFARRGLEPPHSFEQVLACARALHQPGRNLAGIVWNAAPGVPIAETFLQLLGAQTGDPADVGRPEALQTVHFLRELVRYSPPGLARMDWARSAQSFGRGEAAMCLNWSNRLGLMEGFGLLHRRDEIGALEHPTVDPARRPVQPLGGALLAIPSRLDPARAATAWRVIETLASAELAKYFILHGAVGNSLLAVAGDRYVDQRSRLVGVIHRLAWENRIATFRDPELPAYSRVMAALSLRLTRMVFDPAADAAAELRHLARELRAMRTPTQAAGPGA